MNVVNETAKGMRINDHPSDLMIEILGFQKDGRRELKESVGPSEKETPNTNRITMNRRVSPLPRDLTVDILSRLPAKTLCKFRCVSKQWLNLISDPRFIKIHRGVSERIPRLVFPRHTEDTEDVAHNNVCTFQLSTVDVHGRFPNQFTVLIDHTIFQVICCCELICLVSLYPLIHIYVCNPSTQEFARLPDSYYFSTANCVGFGYLPSTNTYKIVRLFCNMTDMRCEIFTMTDGGGINSSGGGWRVIGDCPCRLTAGTFPVCVNGAIYWFFDIRNKGILSLDLEKEEFSFIPLPHGYSNCEIPFVFLVGWNGFLCLVEKLCSVDNTMHIWMLKDHQNYVWVKEFSVDCSTIMYGHINCCVPLVIREGELSIVSGKHLYHYNIEKKSFRREEDLDILTPTLGHYFDSFFSLGSR